MHPNSMCYWGLAAFTSTLLSMCEYYFQLSNWQNFHNSSYISTNWAENWLNHKFKFKYILLKGMDDFGEEVLQVMNEASDLVKWKTACDKCLNSASTLMLTSPHHTAHWHFPEAPALCRHPRAPMQLPGGQVPLSKQVGGPKIKLLTF